MPKLEEFANFATNVQYRHISCRLAMYMKETFNWMWQVALSATWANVHFSGTLVGNSKHTDHMC